MLKLGIKHLGRAILIVVIIAVATALFVAVSMPKEYPFGLPTPKERELWATRFHPEWPRWKHFAVYLVGDELKIGSLTIFDVKPEKISQTKGVLRGDLGTLNVYRNVSINTLLGTKWPLSAQLVVMALGMGLFIGLPLGFVIAFNKNSWLNYLITGLSGLGLTTSYLIISLGLIWLFGFRLGWLPSSGWGAESPYLKTMFTFEFNWLNYFKHALLPVLSLGIALVVAIARLTRHSLAQTMEAGYLQVARAKGLSEQVVIYKHLLKNSVLVIAKALKSIFTTLIFGSIIVEILFRLNGLGYFLMQSINNRDYVVLGGIVLLYGVALVGSNLLFDLFYAYLDPKV